MLGFVADLPSEEHHIGNFDAGSFFSLHDFDGNGHWDEIEIQTFYGLYDKSNKDTPHSKKEEVVTQCMNLMDKDGDSAITRAEWMAFVEGGGVLPDFGVGPGHHGDDEYGIKIPLAVCIAMRDTNYHCVQSTKFIIGKSTSFIRYQARREVANSVSGTTMRIPRKKTLHIRKTLSILHTTITKQMSRPESKSSINCLLLSKIYHKCSGDIEEHVYNLMLLSYRF